MAAANPMARTFVGIDIGAETVKLALCEPGADGRLRTVSTLLREHHREPKKVLREVLADIDWSTVAGAAVTGRLARLLELPRVPIKQAQVAGLRYHFPDLQTATIVSIGGHGFSVLEVREGGVEIFRENSRCSQGTGNFLCQLVERFDITLDEATRLCESVTDPAPLSGRCPVILKTDMTHLANKGEDRARILAGLYDAVCENVQVLIKPRLAPPNVVLIGGVTRARRVQNRFGAWLREHEMALIDGGPQASLFLEACGCAALAARQTDFVAPSLGAFFAEAEGAELERVPGLSASLHRVHRMPRAKLAPSDGPARAIILGFDIGSTGSKCLAIDGRTSELLWETYLNTNGDPVGAAKGLMARYGESALAHHDLQAFGVTGSGREIVGSLLSVCYGPERVFVLNEIAAHAEGARHFDPTVDTIFEIGGQDAKYIRLTDGRVTDAAMNEACSAGTGSFIAEQGKRFAGVKDVVHLGQIASEASCGVSLGQHCSVYMAEVIDEAVASGAPQEAIIAGLYDSIIQNYLNRVKGARTVGQRIFCQGMPFASDALAAAVARQTGSDVVIPPNPGTVGALGIALLARRSLEIGDASALATSPLQPARFLTAKVLGKDTFQCPSTKGCGEPGNKCRVERLRTEVVGEQKRFLWGGSCSLYDRGTKAHKLPDLAPDPFRERENLIAELDARVSVRRGRPTIGVTDEFALKSLFPFFATFLHELGFDLVVRRGADHALLKRGIEGANVPFCAPMQQYHGRMTALAAEGVDYLLLPMLRGLPRVKDEPCGVLCPIVQGSQDVIRLDLGDKAPRLLLPIIDVGEGNLASDTFRKSCANLAGELGLGDELRWAAAFARARSEQARFDAELVQIGRRALAFCAEKAVTPVVVLGRVYTIYNTVLNSNVPALLREQGALPIPVDCYPIDDDAPVFGQVYWGNAQRSLRAAHQIRRTPGQYSMYCSNYSCGPDSFNLHFYSYSMEGRPFAIIETDGHSGDAGTKTRIEAFLHCVREDQAGEGEREANDFQRIDQSKTPMGDIRRKGELLLIPRMGPDAEVLAACYRGLGYRAEALPMPGAEALALGRRQTSGKECLPMTLTTGALLQRIKQEKNPDERFAFFMPKASGPCRFGAYHLLHEIILERTGLANRVRVFSPADEDYFAEAERGFQIVVWAGFLAQDLLQQALYHTRPAELAPGAAARVYHRFLRRLLELVQREAAGDLRIHRALTEVGTGRLFGVRDLLRDAAATFSKIYDARREMPTVSMVGEIYVRCDPAGNAFVVDKLQERGLRVRFAPFSEWIEYTTWVAKKKRQQGQSRDPRHPLLRELTAAVQSRVQAITYQAIAPALGWPRRTRVRDTVEAAAPYVNHKLFGEAVLTVGGPVHEHREGLIDGVLSVGPLECMPQKLSEAQFFHVAEKEGLLALTLPLNGEPFDVEVVENFVFEVKERFARRRATAAQASGSTTERGARAPLSRVPAAAMQWASRRAEQASELGTALGELLPLAAGSMLAGHIERLRRARRRSLPIVE